MSFNRNKLFVNLFLLLGTFSLASAAQGGFEVGNGGDGAIDPKLAMSLADIVHDSYSLQKETPGEKAIAWKRFALSAVDGSEPLVQERLHQERSQGDWTKVEIDDFLAFVKQGPSEKDSVSYQIQFFYEQDQVIVGKLSGDLL